MLKSLISYGFCLTAFQLLIACGPAAQDAPSGSVAEGQAATDVSDIEKSNSDGAVSADPDTLILAFGDSLYAGYGLSPNEGFVPRLQKALRVEGKNVKIHNAGVSGDTTAAGLRRMDFVLDSLARKPDLAILGLGGNDLLRGLKPSETRSNMEAMVKKLKDRDIPIMLTGMVAPINLGKEYGAEFNGIYPNLAKEYDTELYPFFMNGLVGRADLILGDGIHPNADGINLIVEQITPAVVTALNR